VNPAIRLARAARAVAVLRLAGVRVGSMPYLAGLAPIIDGGSRIRAGRRLRIVGRQHRVQLGTGPHGRIVLGDHVFLNQGANVFAASAVHIGDHTRLADLATVYDSDFHEIDEGAGVRVAPVHIGRNVWIGRGATVLPGCSIGDHSVIAAGAVVTGDVPARSLAAGVPARVIRSITCSDDYRRP
jgi:acetyltransferase-like isoleucine patch superfamily enzyme